MKNIIVSGYVGFNNFGDEAIFYVLSKHLKENGYSVSVLANNPKEVEKKYGVSAFYYKNLKQIFYAILDNDILISGGGSLLQNKTSNFSLIYYLSIIIFAKLLFKKVIIFSQGIEPIRGKFFELLTRMTLKMADFVSVRDEKSYELLKSWKIKAYQTSDPIYAIIQNKQLQATKTALTIQLRDFYNIPKDFVKDFASIVQKYINNNDEIKNNVKVFSFQDEYDEKISMDFVDELKKYNIKAEYIGEKSVQETIKIINNSKYVISTRLHGALLAHALESKTFALCYDDKIKNFSNELNLENIDIRNYDVDDFDEKLKNFFENDHKTNDFKRFKWEYIDTFLHKYGK